MTHVVTASPRQPHVYAWQGLLALVGRGTPREQVLASLVFGALAYVIALLTFGLAAVLVLVAAVFLVIGIVRWLVGVVR